MDRMEPLTVNLPGCKTVINKPCVCSSTMRLSTFSALHRDLEQLQCLLLASATKFHYEHLQQWQPCRCWIGRYGAIYNPNFSFPNFYTHKTGHLNVAVVLNFIPTSPVLVTYLLWHFEHQYGSLSMLQCGYPDFPDFLFRSSICKDGNNMAPTCRGSLLQTDISADMECVRLSPARRWKVFSLAQGGGRTFFCKILRDHDG